MEKSVIDFSRLLVLPLSTLTIFVSLVQANNVYFQNGNTQQGSSQFGGQGPMFGTIGGGQHGTGSNNGFRDGPLRYHVDFNERHPGEDLVALESQRPGQSQYLSGLRRYPGPTIVHGIPFLFTRRGVIDPRHMGSGYGQGQQWNYLAPSQSSWWTGAHVCTERIEHDEQPAISGSLTNDDRRDGAATGKIQVSKCEDSGSKHVCVSRLHVAGHATKVITTTYDCCAGYILNTRSQACERSPYSSFTQTMQKLGATEFLKLVQTMNLTGNTEVGTMTLFVPTDDAIQDYLHPVASNETTQASYTGRSTRQRRDVPSEAEGNGDNTMYRGMRCSPSSSTCTQQKGEEMVMDFENLDWFRNMVGSEERSTTAEPTIDRSHSRDVPVVEPPVVSARPYLTGERAPAVSERPYENPYGLPYERSTTTILEGTPPSPTSEPDEEYYEDSYESSQELPYESTTQRANESPAETSAPRQSEERATDRPTHDPYGRPAENPHNGQTENYHHYPTEDPYRRPYEDPHLRPSENPYRTPHETPRRTSHEDPQRTPYEDPRRTSHEDSRRTPHEDPRRTPHEDARRTSHEDPRRTPYEDPRRIPHEDPQRIPHEDPRRTPYEDPRRIPHEDPRRTLYEDPRRTPYEDPRRTSYEDPRRTPYEDRHGRPSERPDERPTENTNGQNNLYPHEQSTARSSNPSHHQFEQQPRYPSTDHSYQSPYQRPGQHAQGSPEEISTANPHEQFNQRPYHHNHAVQPTPQSPWSPLETALAKSRDIMEIRDSVLSHMVPRLILTHDFHDEKIIYTDKADSVIRMNTFNVKGEIVYTVNCVRMTSTNNRCSNGVIHIVSKMMTPVTQSLFDLVSSNPKLSIFKSLLEKSEKLGDLRDRNQHLTLFAPSNDALISLAPKFLARLRNGGSCLERIIRNHIVPVTFCTSVFQKKGQIRNLNHDIMDVERISKTEISINGSQIMATDVMALNGVVQILDGVLMSKEDGPLSTRLANIGLTTFSTYLKQAGIALDDFKDVTVFAPSNEAFETLSEEIKADRQKLETILKYHIATPGVQACDFTNEQKMTTEVRGSYIRMNKYEDSTGYRSEVTAQCGRLTKLSEVACNGVVHTLDRVLAPLDMDIAQVLRTRTEFNILNRLIAENGLIDLLRGPGPMTIFAPTDEAFNALPRATLESLLRPGEEIQRILKLHIISQNLCCSGIFPHGLYSQSVVTLLGGQRVGVHKGRNGDFNFGSGKISTCDLMASNGVIHAVDSVKVSI